MNNWTPKNLGIAVVVIAVLVGIWFLVGQQKVTAPEEALPASGSPPGSSATPPAANPPVSNGGTVTPTPATKPPVSTPTVSPTGFRFITPQIGEVWAISATHPIEWNKASNIAGGLYLVDEKTGKTVGWIIPTTGANQLTYSWDTVNVSVDRIGGNRTTLAPGTYSLHLTFDGKAASVASPSFTLAAKGAPEVVSIVVRLKDGRMTPNSLGPLARGSKIVFVNNETKSQKLTGVGMPPITVPSGGGIYVLDTSTLASGTYNFTSDLYSYLSQGTLVIK